MIVTRREARWMGPSITSSRRTVQNGVLDLFDLLAQLNWQLLEACSKVCVCVFCVLLPPHFLVKWVWMQVSSKRMPMIVGGGGVLRLLS